MSSQRRIDHFFSQEASRDDSHANASVGSPSRDAKDEQEHGSQELARENNNDDCDTSKSKCFCPCCANPDVAHQPSNLEFSKIKGQSFSRSIQGSWYEKYKWISVCTPSYKIYCHVCCLALKRGLLTFSKRHNLAFLEGFCNWKKALECFSHHEKSEMHQEALLKVTSLRKSVNVAQELNLQLRSEQKNHRTMFMKLLECILFLARQGLSFRGHHEDSTAFEGNLYQLLLLQAKHNDLFGGWLKKREYLSPEITNELISMCGQALLRKVLKDIHKSEFISLIANEATDITHNEQLCVAIRWVDGNYNVHETPLGLFKLPDTFANTIFTVIKDLLTRCSLSLSNCIGQAYDRASNMSGVRNGVQALVKKEAGNCLYVHCFAHSLNLSIQEVTRKCDVLSGCLEFIYHLVQLIKYSPKRQTLFDNLRKSVTVSNSDSLPSPSLRTLCPTRWTVRHSAIDSILKNYDTLMSTLDIVQRGHDEYAAKAKGLLLKMESFSIFFGLKLAYLIYTPAEQFSINLQAQDTITCEALKGAHLLSSHYSTLRTEGAFTSFYEDVLKASKDFTDEPILPRYRKAPRRFEGTQQVCFSSPEEMYRVSYFEALDCACSEVQRRFDQSDLATISNIESILLDASNGKKPTNITQDIQDFFEDKVDFSRLEVQLQMLPDALKSNQDCNILKEVTSIRTIANALSHSSTVKGMLSEVDKIIRAYFTFPVTSATAERAFSTLRRIKTFLRSSMTQQRLNNLFLMYVFKEETSSLDLITIANDFASANSRRQNYFGHF